MYQGGHCSRCSTIIEPLLSDQWFVKMAPLADKGLKPCAKRGHFCRSVTRLKTG